MRIDEEEEKDVIMNGTNVPATVFSTFNNDFFIGQSNGTSVAIGRALDSVGFTDTHRRHSSGRSGYTAASLMAPTSKQHANTQTDVLMTDHFVE